MNDFLKVSFLVLVLATMILVLGLLVLRLQAEDEYDFCYVCDYPYTYVKVKGKDTEEMKKKVYELYACTANATLPHCSVLTDKNGKTRIYGVVK